MRDLRRPSAVAMTLALVVGLLPGTAPTAAAATLPAGFREVVVFRDLNQPISVAFAPDGRVFVAEKRGVIKVFDGLTDTTPDVFADLRTNVYDYWDRGLLGMELDPEFPAQPYVYVIYTYDHILGDPAAAPRWNDACPSPPASTGDGCVASGRLSRLRAAGNVMTGAEQVLVEDWCQQFPSHSVGSIAFGTDGSLYASGGDGASFNFADYGQAGGTAGSPTPKNPCGDPPAGVGGTMTAPTAEGGALRSQDVRSTGDPTGLSGTLIRVDRATGLGMPGNPFASSSDLNARRIVAYGFRNPYRITDRPGTNEIWVSDVGWSTWEELNRVASPADATADNFGWPCYEGVGRQPNYDGLNLNLCESLYTTGAVVSPHYTYKHTDSIVSGEACNNGQGSSTVGMAFYEGGPYPPAYDGALFFADYSRNCLWVMERGTNGLPDPAKRSNFVTPAASPVDLEIGPNGDLFYVDIVGGTIRRIEYSASNTAPVASATASPRSGPAPLTVTFDGSASSDADGEALSYAWDLDGDGAFDDASTAVAPFTYTSRGRYAAALRVTDPRGATDTSAPITIDVGLTPPVPVIDTPSAGFTWSVGQDIDLLGHATDAEEGSLPPAALSWTVIIKHCTSQGCHDHVEQTSNGDRATLDGPDHPYPSYLEIRLTARDSDGLTGTTSVSIQPKTVDLTFRTEPAGLLVALGGDAKVAPFTQTVIQGSKNSVTAVATQDLNGIRYAFRDWTDGATNPREIIPGSAPGTYTARFMPVSADLAVIQTGSATGSQATFVIRTRNLGPAPATGVVLSETLPSKLTFVSAPGCTYTASNRLVQCQLGGIAAGAETTITLTAGNKGKGNIANTVQVSSTTPDPATGNNTSTLTLKPR